VCSNLPLTDNSQGVINFAPLGVANPPFFMGAQFYYFCADPNVYELTGDAVTTCEDNGQFTQDANPPACAQISKKNRESFVSILKKKTEVIGLNHTRGMSARIVIRSHTLRIVCQQKRLRIIIFADVHRG